MKVGVVRRVIQRMKDRIALDKKSYIVYVILRALVLVTLVRCIMLRQYESAAVCVLALLLFLVPSLAEDLFYLNVPTIFQILIYCFIFAAEILGEINHYYVKIPGWDTVLHTLNGFLAAAVGFSMIDLLNRREDKQFKLSPVYLAMMAFCFSMTVGVIWEFFECFMDLVFLTDMQKDYIVTQFSSVNLDPSGSGDAFAVKGIEQTIIQTTNGDITVSGGYLDIGLYDTMKDLFVNFIGAVVFSVFGYLYITHRGKANSRVVNGFVIRPVSKEQRKEEDSRIEQMRKMKKEKLSKLKPVSPAEKKETEENLPQEASDPGPAAEITKSPDK